MLNWPLKLRTQKSFCSPKGPNFAWAQNIQFSLDGSTIQLRAPRHRSSYAGRELRHPPRRMSIADLTFRPYPEDFVVDDSWESVDLAYRSWGFYGPWFSGALAEMSMYIGLITPAEPKAGVSFFHPRAFEHAVGDYLTQQYAKSIPHGKSEWAAPVDWQVIHSLPCVAASLTALPNQEVSSKTLEKLLLFPVGDQYLVKLKFIPSLRHKPVDPQPMQQLMADIINSLRVSLSPAVLAQQARALEGLADSALIEQFPPMKWTTPKQDAEWAAYREENKAFYDLRKPKT